MNRVYLDHAAASPVDPEALEAFREGCDLCFANTSSVHSFAQRADFALQNARERLTNLLNAPKATAVFTATGTEADNLAILGCALAAQKKFGHNHIIISAAEHPAVDNSARRLQQEYQFEVTRVPVDAEGFPQASAIEAAIRPSTALCSFLLANNEVGTISPLKSLARLCKEKNPGVMVHTDAVQAAAWTLLDFSDLESDIITIGGHKFGSPGGGALIARKQVPLIPLTVGGGHEHGLRAGTPNVPEILALVRALEVRREKLWLGADNIAALRDSLVRGILDSINGVTLTGHPTQRLPNHASFVFESLEGNTLARMLDFKGFAVSPGAACKTGNPAPSAVLTAMGLSRERAMGGLRISLGFETRADDISALLHFLPEAVARARASFR